MTFEKYQGLGNDFVIVDGRDPKTSFSEHDLPVSEICDRKFGIGADGLIYISPETMFTARMHYFNADGGRVSMCGNGARCVARFLADCNEVTSGEIATDAGTYQFENHDDQTSSLLMPSPEELGIEMTDHLAGPHGVYDSGVPHIVIEVKDVKKIDLMKGREYRRLPRFENGTNTNWISDSSMPGKYFMRTYERGVEDETLACGTGALAAAFYLWENEKELHSAEITMLAPGGPLIHQRKEMSDSIWQRASATKVFSGSYQF